MFGAAAFSSAPFSGLLIESANVVVALTGVYGTGEVGTVIVPVWAVVPVTGVSATGQVGTVGVLIPTIVTVTGVYATGYTYTPQIWCKINADADPLWKLIAA